MSKIKQALLLVGLISLISIAIALIGTEIVKRTSNAEFCVSCHAMQPMVNTYQRDTHGGRNPHGFSAECTDCHLPHNNTLNYLWVKAKMGANDLFKVLFTDTNKIDWHHKRQQRTEFVFDSGCLNCHQQLFNRTQVNHVKSLETHQIYLDSQITQNRLQCVSCHVTVGHNGEMRSELNKIYPEGYQFQLDLQKKE